MSALPPKADIVAYLISLSAVARAEAHGLLRPTLLGSVDKARSGVAAGVLNSTRQTGSVLGVAVFGSLIRQADAFLFGARIALIISTVLLIAAAAAIMSSEFSLAHRRPARATHQSR